MDAQLVISLGGGGSPQSLQELPGNPLVGAAVERVKGSVSITCISLPLLHSLLH